MSQGLTKSEKINVVNIILTLFLSAIAVILSYNSYNISILSLEISKNTYALSEKIDKINNVQSDFELKMSIYTLLTTIDMQRQNDIGGKNILKCIKILEEMKSILVSQMKNTTLIENKELSELWFELHSRINFYIKYIESGLKENTIVTGKKEMIMELGNKTNAIIEKYHKRNTNEISGDAK